MGPPSISQPRPSGRLQIEDDLGNSADQTVFFKILRSNAGACKVVRLPAAAGCRLDFKSLVVMMYKAKCVGDTTFVSVDPVRQASSSTPVAVVDIFSASTSAIVDDLEMWSTGKKLQYGFGSKLGECEDRVLNSMVDAGAFAGSDNSFVGSTLDSACNNVMEAHKSNDND